MNRFLRTAPTRRLLTVIFATVAVIAAGATIAIAAAGSGPVPARKGLAQAIHDALAAPKVQGISANIQFTNHLIGSTEIQGSDPLLTGATGRVWLTSDHRFRLELQGDNGDANIVVGDGSWWAYFPSTNTVYEGTLPAHKQAKRSGQQDKLPSVAQIQTQLNKFAAHLGLSGAAPTDVAGQPTYTVTISPKPATGLLGSVQLAWDALKGVPLRFAVYARGDSSPVIELAATGVTYGPVPSGVFSMSPPAGAKVVKVSTPASAASAASAKRGSKRRGHHTEVAGVAAVQSHVKFTLAAPATLAGMSRQTVRLLGLGGRPAALLTYGQGLGGIAVLEQPATAQTAKQLNLSQGSGDHQRGIELPTAQINGTTAQELDTELGTVVRFTRGGVTYTVLGSVSPSVADTAARGL